MLRSRSARLLAAAGAGTWRSARSVVLGGSGARARPPLDGSHLPGGAAGGGRMPPLCWSCRHAPSTPATAPRCPSVTCWWSRCSCRPGPQSSRCKKVNTAASSFNTAVPCSTFSCGEIWIQDGHGEEPFDNRAGAPLGTRLPIVKPCVHFNAHMPHCTCAWQGDRIVLAFCIRNHGKLAHDDVHALHAIGFPL